MMNHYFVLSYLDYVLIYSNTYEEHIHRVLEVLWEKKLYAKCSNSKSILGYPLYI